MNSSKQLLTPRIKISFHISRTCARTNTTKSSAEYCMNLVKNYDYENFISTLLLKKSFRSCAFAVRSFNVEIARIAEQVSQKDIGLMRMQFWEETLEKCFLNEFNRIPRHPVAIELFRAISNHKLSKRNLKNLIVSRKEHLNLRGFNSLDDMEKYSERSVSSIYYLILEGYGIKDINADHVASHLGKAQGIVQHLRSIPEARRLNFIPIPQVILVKNNVSHEEVMRTRASKPLSDCIHEIATRAHQHLMKARSLRGNVPVESCSVFLPAIPIFAYLDRLEKVDYDIFDPKLKYRKWNLLLQMWLTNFKNKY